MLIPGIGRPISPLFFVSGPFALRDYSPVNTSEVNLWLSVAGGGWYDHRILFWVRNSHGWPIQMGRRQPNRAGLVAGQSEARRLPEPAAPTEPTAWRARKP
jgi:hypothetical protein